MITLYAKKHPLGISPLISRWRNLQTVSLTVFYVMIKRVEGKPMADRSLMIRAKELEMLLGDSVYVAIVKQDGTQMMVDRALKERMLYLPEKLVVEDLVLSGPTPNQGRSM
ncbi:hypothetical protein ALQ44_00647 [Pseudomonas syringae pv. pisi]|uniref:Uncharacterized protein n=3 Tax=Pseudomonas syringae TaxID=317 RepID=A0A3M3UG40_PSESJ|nr:hypothetical protein ALQ44_00647 [Pseudomonas syringae pv. pisi]